MLALGFCDRVLAGLVTQKLLNEDGELPSQTPGFPRLQLDLHGKQGGVKGVGGGSEALEGGIGVLNNANYGQKTYSNTFSVEGRKIYSDLAGEPINTIDDLVNSVNSGKIDVAELPVEYIVSDRISQTLIQTGIQRSQWNSIDRTGDALFEELFTGQLSRNKLTLGISTVRSSGGQ